MKHPPANAEIIPTDVADLRAFCRVVDLGSITAAAKGLGETKGSVSRRLSRLERALGVVLLRRSPRLVQATEDGVAYRARVGRVLELLDDANLQARRADDVPSGHLRVTAPIDLGVTMLPSIITTFVERYPEVSVEAVLTPTTLDFDAHQIDVAFRAGGTLADSSLVAHRLQTTVGGWFASPRYLKKNGTPAKLDDLASHRLLSARMTRGHGTVSMQRKGETVVTPLEIYAAISSPDFAFPAEAAVAGAGIALLPTLVAKQHLDAGRLVRVLESYSLVGGTLYLVHHATRLLSPKVRAFRDHALASCAARGVDGERSVRASRYVAPV